jgi:putative oxidoreductase
VGLRIALDPRDGELLHAAGRCGTGSGFESLGIRPAVVAAVLAGSAELAAGFSLAAGLLRPVGTVLVGAVMITAITVLVGAVMITAIFKVHVSNGIWAAEGGFEFPLVLLTVGIAITALGPRSLSVDSWLGIDNWAGINWTINPAARSAIALAIGLAGGMVVAMASWASKRTPTHASRRRRADALRVGKREGAVVRRAERRSSAGIRRGKAAREARGRSPSGCCAVSSRSCAPMPGDIHGTRAAAAGALHVTVAGDTQHGSTQRDALLRLLPLPLSVHFHGAHSERHFSLDGPPADGGARAMA